MPIGFLFFLFYREVKVDLIMTAEQLLDVAVAAHVAWKYFDLTGKDLSCWSRIAYKCSYFITCICKCQRNRFSQQSSGTDHRDPFHITSSFSFLKELAIVPSRP